MTEGGGSAASDQIDLEMGSPPSAFGITPARGAKGTYSKVSARGQGICELFEGLGLDAVQLRAT